MNAFLYVDLRTLPPLVFTAVLDQEGVLRDVKDDEGKCNMKIIRLKSKLRLIF